MSNLIEFVGKVSSFGARIVIDGLRTPFEGSQILTQIAEVGYKSLPLVAPAADIIIDGIGGEVLSEGLGALAFEGSLTTLGYSASRQTTIDVTKLIVPQASIRSLTCSLKERRSLRTLGTLLSLCLNQVRSNRSWRRPSRWPTQPKRCVT